MNRQHREATSFELAAAAANAAESKKALQVRLLDVEQISTVADYFLVCTGESQTQIKAITEAVLEAMKKQERTPIGQERGGKWHLLDYGELVIHVMHPSMREFYNIEEFWNHAAPIDEKQWRDRQAS